MKGFCWFAFFAFEHWAMLFCGSCMLLWLFDGSLAFAACPALVASVSGSCCLLDLGYAVWFVMFFGLYYHDISIQPSHDCCHLPKRTTKTTS